jgi:hypothetical protein
MAIKLEHNVLVTTSVTGEQVVHSLTVAGSPFTIKLLTLGAAYTTYNATEAYLGFARFQFDLGLGAGWETKDRSPAFVNTDLDNNNPMIIRPLGSGHILAVGEAIRAICNPSTATSIRWACSMWGST